MPLHKAAKLQHQTEHWRETSILCCYCLHHSLAFCAAALSPDKSSLAAEKLKENLRAEGVLEQLVYAAQRHAMQEEDVATPSQTDADDR